MQGGGTGQRPSLPTRLKGRLRNIIPWTRGLGGGNRSLSKEREFPKSKKLGSQSSSLRHSKLDLKDTQRRGTYPSEGTCSSPRPENCDTVSGREMLHSNFLANLVKMEREAEERNRVRNELLGTGEVPVSDLGANSRISSHSETITNTRSSDQHSLRRNLSKAKNGICNLAIVTELNRKGSILVGGSMPVLNIGTDAILKAVDMLDTQVLVDCDDVIEELPLVFDLKSKDIRGGKFFSELRHHEVFKTRTLSSISSPLPLPALNRIACTSPLQPVQLNGALSSVTSARILASLSCVC